MRLVVFKRVEVVPTFAVLVYIVGRNADKRFIRKASLVFEVKPPVKSDVNSLKQAFSHNKSNKNRAFYCCFFQRTEQKKSY